MATYTDIQGKGKLTTANITGSTTITITTPATLIGVAYFVLEAIRNSDEVYTSSSPSLEGSFGSLNGVTGLVNSPHIFSVVVENGGGSFTYTPTTQIDAGEAYVRGTGGITVEIS